MAAGAGGHGGSVEAGPSAQGRLSHAERGLVLEAFPSPSAASASADKGGEARAGARPGPGLLRQLSTAAMQPMAAMGCGRSDPWRCQRRPRHGAARHGAQHLGRVGLHP